MLLLISHVFHFILSSCTFSLPQLSTLTAGDLHQALKLTALNRLPEARVKFYAAEIVLALEHLHALGIMYRYSKELVPTCLPVYLFSCIPGHMETAA